MARANLSAAEVDVHSPKALLNPAILIQLAFRHMLVVLRVTTQLKKLLPSLAQLAPVLPPRKNLSSKVSIQELLSELIAPFDDRLVDHPWSPPLGALSKVRRDVSRLSAELSKSEEVFAWWETIEETWRAAVVASESPLHAALMKFVKLVDRAALQMFSVIELFRTNENVLLCLLRYHMELDEWIGRGHTSGLLQRIHARGIAGVESFMIKSYRKRGFHEIIPQISQAIAEMSDQVV